MVDIQILKYEENNFQTDISGLKYLSEDLQTAFLTSLSRFAHPETELPMPICIFSFLKTHIPT